MGAVRRARVVTVNARKIALFALAVLFVLLIAALLTQVAVG